MPLANAAAKPVERQELHDRRRNDESAVLIDVRLEEDFEAAHIPGAVNACVFNVTFLNDVQRLVPERSRPVFLYGSSSRDLASAVAGEKLIGAGYKTVLDYRAGLEDWRGGGMPMEGKGIEPLQIAPPADGKHLIEVAKSHVEWTGRNLLSTHTGTIRLKEGFIEIRGGQPVSGEFTIDMRAIEDTDIMDAGMRSVLEHHLKSDDFFDVERFPTARFALTQVTPIPVAPLGTPNATLAGELTMKGITRPIVFPAFLSPTAEGALAADAHFDIDRTQWNVLYGSGRFFERLGKHLVNDQISLGLKIVTVPRS